MKPNSGAHSALVEAIRIHLAGKVLEARSRYEAFLRTFPPHGSALHLLGVTYLQTQEPAKGLGWIEMSLRLEPDQPEALNSLGAALKALRRHEEALAAIEKSLSLKPNHLDALDNLGGTLYEMRRYEEAIAAYRKALVLKPDHACILSNLGAALQEVRRHDEARDAHERALAINPGLAEAHNNLAALLQEQNRLEEALPHLEKAISLKPGYAVAYNNLATVLLELNRHDEAGQACALALAARPDYGEAAWNQGLLHLVRGNFRDGWPLYEKRWARHRAEPPPAAPCPLWLGEDDLAGRQLLIQAEQGLGDLLQMIRYLPLLEERGATCWVQAPETLRALLGRSFPQARIVALGECPPGCEYRVPLMSLPLALKTDTETAIPRDIPYLAADPAKTDRWRERLAGGPARRIGFAWRSNPENLKGSLHRSARLADFLPLLARQDTQYVALQKNLTREEKLLLASHPGVVVLDRELESLDDTAAVTAALDHVVTIDSVMVHVAGALGRPGSIVLPFGADWRWMAGRPDSPWYPTLRLFRQARPGDWSGPVREAGEWEALTRR